MMSRILALDIGDQRIGVAVSDALGWTAQPVKTIQRIGKKKDAEAIEQLIRELGVSDLVVGLPKKHERNRRVARRKDDGICGISPQKDETSPSLSGRTTDDGFRRSDSD